VVVGTEPDTFASVQDFRGPVRFRFDERISERTAGGTMDDAVLVSPRTGSVRVRPGRRELTVELEGGFRPGLVYRVTLLPVLSDLFNNQLRDPFEIVFSTGGVLIQSAVAGLVWDRVTGNGVEGLQVLAIQDSDSTVHVARADSGGIYAFRYLPADRYRVVAFQDRNRNDQVDRMEVQGSRAVLVGGPDTLLLDVGVLQPDTTPARLTSVQVLDSATLVLEFDDALDPTVSGDNASVALELEQDTTRDAAADSVQPGPPPAVVRILHAHEYVSWVEQVRDSFARLDSLDVVAAMSVGEQVAGDTLAGPPGLQELPTPRVPPTALPPPGGGRVPTARPRSPEGVQAATGPDGRVLPGRRLVALLEGFLEANVAYRLRAGGIVNLSEVPLGGGEAAVVREPPPPPDTAAADTLEVPDSLAVPDTAAADTTTIPPDTGRVTLPLFARPEAVR
jgi:hypothetical protein